MNVICREQNGETFSTAFSNHKLTIGWESSNSLVVTAAGVAERHAVLIEKDGCLFVADCGSLNGTFVNREKITGEHQLCSGDTIQIGIQQIKVEFIPDSDTVTLHFISKILDEENSEDFTAMTIIADERLQNMIEAERLANKNDTDTDQKIVVTSSEDIFIEGREVGKYQIIKRIGKGGMGEVYLAKHKALGTLRALKVLPKAMKEENAKFFDRFMREAKLAAEIKHSNIVGVMDIETDEKFGFAYIVMEYIDGGSLRRILKSSNHLSEEQSVIIVEAVAAALHAAEERGIVHRDIKPDNIMFTKQGEVKLADLGIAKDSEEDNELTNANVMLGTPAYLSPEQVQNARDVDIRADIYSLGATFYEMLTGQHPYPGQTTYDIVHKLFYDPVPDPRKINPEISEATAGIVMKMLAKNADERFQSAAEFLEIMEKTFPTRTPGEVAELVKKAISGNCEDDAAFRSEITTVHMGKKTKLKGLYGTIIVLFCILLAAAGSLVYSYLQQHKDKKPVPPPELPMPVEKTFVLTIKTIPHAEVMIEDKEENGSRSFHADSSGFLKIRELNKGNYMLKITLPDYRPWEEEIEISEQTERDIQLVPDLITVKIITVPGAHIKMSATQITKEFSVPESGILEIPELKKRMYRVEISYEGFFTLNKEIQLDADNEIELPLEPVYKILRLRTVPFAKVGLYRNSQLYKSETADATGRCFLDGIRKGTYELQLYAPGYEKRSLMLTFDTDLDLKDISLQRQYYSLSISTQSGTKVSVKQNGIEITKFTIQQSGTCKLEKLTEGHYDLVLSKEGFQQRKYSVDLKGDVSVPIELIPEKVPLRSPEPPPMAQSAPPQKKPLQVPEKKQGTIRFKLAFAENTSETFKKYIAKLKLQISIGTQDRISVSQFPHTVQVDVPETGELQIKVKGPGLDDLEDSVFVKEDQTVDFFITPYASLSQVKFSSNHAETIFYMDNRKYDAGQKITIKPFKVYTVTAVYDSRKITKDFISNYPGKVVTVDCPFQEIVHPFQQQYEEGLMMFKEKKYKEALPLLVEAAENKHPDASYLVAEIYNRGLGMWLSDKKTAMQWYFNAAELGHVKAAYIAAEVIRKNSYDAPVEKMVQFYVTAMKEENAAAAYRLCLIYREGFKSIAADEEKEFDYLKKAAGWEHPDAMYDLGMKYVNGTGIPRNSETALYWLKKAAEAGHKKAREYIDAVQ